MNRIVNIELLANPMNWIIVALMTAFAAFALAAIMKQQGTY